MQNVIFLILTGAREGAEEEGEVFGEGKRARGFVDRLVYYSGSDRAGVHIISHFLCHRNPLR
jgi:hypothetical protein